MRDDSLKLGSAFKVEYMKKLPPVLERTSYPPEILLSHI